MPHKNSKTQETVLLQDTIIINSTVENHLPMKICWNTGEEKNCVACYLSKGCKAKA